MEDETKLTESLSEARKQFEIRFREALPRLRGSEEETVVYKQMAWGWFQMGRCSMVKEARGKLLEQLRNFYSLAESARGD